MNRLFIVPLGRSYPSYPPRAPQVALGTSSRGSRLRDEPRTALPPGPLGPLGWNPDTTAALRQGRKHRHERGGENVVLAPAVVVCGNCGSRIPRRCPECPVRAAMHVRDIHRFPTCDRRRCQDPLPLILRSSAIELRERLGAVQVAGLLPGLSHLVDLLWRQAPEIVK